MPIDRFRRNRGRKHPTYDHGEPVRWISLAPLAGIFAIAGALIASSYGVRPHAVMVDLPMPYPNEDMGPLTPNMDRLVLTNEGAILWNGTEVTEQELEAILSSTTRMDDHAALLFAPEAEVTYERAIRLLDLLRRHGALDRCFRFSGIARFRQYDEPDTFDELLPYTRQDCLPLPPGHAMPSTVR